MTPQRMAALVTGWARLYTRGLPTPIARRRIDEIDADLHDHIAHERAQGTSDRRIAVGIASRTLRGLAADAAWRGHHAGPSTVRRSAVHVALATGLVLLLPLLAMQFTDEVAWGPADFAAAGVLLGGTGLTGMLVVSRARDLVYRAAVAVALAAALLLVWTNLAVGIVGEPGEPASVALNGAFVALFTGSAWRFRRAARKRAAPEE